MSRLPLALVRTELCNKEGLIRGGSVVFKPLSELSCARGCLAYFSPQCFGNIPYSGCSWDGCSAQGGNCPAQGWAEEDGALPAQLPPGTAAPLTPAALLQWRERGGRVPGGCQENLPEHPRREPGPERGRVGRTAQTVSPAGGAANERTPAPERRLWLLVTPPWLLLTPHLWL